MLHAEIIILFLCMYSLWSVWPRIQSRPVYRQCTPANREREKKIINYSLSLSLSLSLSPHHENSIGIKFCYQIPNLRGDHPIACLRQVCVLHAQNLHCECMHAHMHVRVVNLSERQIHTTWTLGAYIALRTRGGRLYQNHYIIMYIGVLYNAYPTSLPLPHT